jgi:hypothetical protein
MEVTQKKQPLDYRNAQCNHVTMHWKRMVLVGVSSVALYVGAYFAVSEPYHATFGGVQMTFRLFDQKWELQFWRPMLIIEEHLRRDEFFGQVRGGAALPSPGLRCGFGMSAAEVDQTEEAATPPVR